MHCGHSTATPSNGGMFLRFAPASSFGFQCPVQLGTGLGCQGARWFTGAWIPLGPASMELTPDRLRFRLLLSLCVGPCRCAISTLKLVKDTHTHPRCRHLLSCQQRLQFSSIGLHLCLQHTNFLARQWRLGQTLHAILRFATSLRGDPHELGDSSVCVPERM